MKYRPTVAHTHHVYIDHFFSSSLFIRLGRGANLSATRCFGGFANSRILADGMAFSAACFGDRMKELVELHWAAQTIEACVQPRQLGCQHGTARIYC